VPEIQIIARYTVSAGKEAEVLGLLSTLAAAARAEPGNRAFTVYRQVDADREVVLLERYASAAALDEHRATRHFKDLVLERIVPLLDRREVETYDVVE
jgi:quinol monooxygenase YgiN